MLDASRFHFGKFQLARRARGIHGVRYWRRGLDLKIHMKVDMKGIRKAMKLISRCHLGYEKKEYSTIKCLREMLFMVDSDLTNKMTIDKYDRNR